MNGYLYNAHGPVSIHCSGDHLVSHMDILLPQGKLLKFGYIANNLACRVIQGSKELALDPDETIELIFCLKDIIREFTSSQDSNSRASIYRQHLGGGTVITISKFGGRKFCDMRRYYSNETVDYGIILTKTDLEIIDGLYVDICALLQRL